MLEDLNKFSYQLKEFCLTIGDNNKIKGSGAKTLGYYLSDYLKLEELFISIGKKNKLCPKSAKYIADGIE